MSTPGRPKGESLSVQREGSPVSLGGVVHLVDDDAMFRTALATVIELAGHTVLVYESAGDFLIGYARSVSPECAIFDLQMPGPSGLELQASLDARDIGVPVIFLSAFGDVPTTVRAMRGGAIDFLTKPVARDTLLGALDAALRQDVAERVSFERQTAIRSRVRQLSARELAVLQQVLAGKRNKQIAGELGIAERTVKTHRAQLMEKMQVQSVAELAELAFELHGDAAAAARVPSAR
jgi:two-component system, LuxR family, response regulator FixJ